MNERFIRRQFNDPTAIETLSHFPDRDTLPDRSTIIPQPKPQSGITRTQAALTELNFLFPGERMKKYAERDPEFNRRRNEIMKGGE